MGMVRRWGTKGKGTKERKYFSAEFQLDSPRIYFQFRLRQVDASDMFVVVKNDSQALDCLHPGEAVAMTFHFEDNDIPAERREVVITSIEDAASLGMKGHVKVAFSL